MLMVMSVTLAAVRGWGAEWVGAGGGVGGGLCCLRSRVNETREMHVFYTARYLRTPCKISLLTSASGAVKGGC
jgi:hypothetical protein